MSKKMSAEELKEHCKEASKGVEAMLLSFVNSSVDKITKRAMLISYWLKTYVKYILKEDSFSPSSVFKLKRGSVIQVEFGYRVGRELGGRHYAVVLDVKNKLHRNTVTVVPLGSYKEGAKYDEYDVILEDGIYSPIVKKIDALIQTAKATLKEMEEMDKNIEQESKENQLLLRAVRRQKTAEANKLVECGQNWINEFLRMQKGSVAKIDQIVTISKMRISAPLEKTHPLYGVRLTSKDMDQIDDGMKKLYFPEV